MSPYTLLILENSINEGMDNVDTELFDWKFIHRYVAPGWFFRIAMRL